MKVCERIVIYIAVTMFCWSGVLPEDPTKATGTTTPSPIRRVDLCREPLKCESKIDIYNISEPTDCSVYHTCNHIKLVANNTCPPAMKFDFNNLSCVDAGVALCHRCNNSIRSTEVYNGTISTTVFDTLPTTNATDKVSLSTTVFKPIPTTNGSTTVSTPSTPTSTSSSGVPCIDSSFNVNCQNNTGITYYPVPEDCTKFVKCTGKRFNYMSCPDKEFFDIDTLQCKPVAEARCAIFCITTSTTNNVTLQASSSTATSTPTTSSQITTSSSTTTQISTAHSSTTNSSTTPSSTTPSTTTSPNTLTPSSTTYSSTNSSEMLPPTLTSSPRTTATVMMGPTTTSYTNERETSVTDQQHLTSGATTPVSSNESCRYLISCFPGANVLDPCKDFGRCNDSDVWTVKDCSYDSDLLEKCASGINQPKAQNVCFTHCSEKVDLQPSERYAINGQQIQFSCSFGKTRHFGQYEPLSFQWFRDDIPITGKSKKEKSTDCDSA